MGTTTRAVAAESPGTLGAVVSGTLSVRVVTRPDWAERCGRM